ncbi:hypothetical protein COV20_02695 [Candidatus Woesearchaeota archaeon CG10_big_fil_rev_8_21_14_0_10_45_16]|nr:MAG: hypothetical protein COV20_02695 [Candidatus Woesearchaeota archaeon CG10_big_fil_rev_8_21_14_0_10_45_16]
MLLLLVMDVHKKKLKIGLALGSGGAKGFAHIGVLKVLHQNKIYPDYIAGTSMGAVIGAAYASGRTPEEIAKIASSIDWKEIVDFTVPKSGLLRGYRIEKKLREIVQGKKFSQLDIPLRVVSYNLKKFERVIFSKGDVTKALRASLSIPGLFNPHKSKDGAFIDGAVTDPTPYDIVRDMGADIVIAVDLYSKEAMIIRSAPKKKPFIEDIKEQFILVELLNLKNYLVPKRWPRFIKKILGWLFDKLLYPARVFRAMTGRQTPEIMKVIYQSIYALSNNLAREQLRNSEVDLIVSPVFPDHSWIDFDESDKFAKLGEKAMQKKIRALKKLLS